MGSPITFSGFSPVDANQILDAIMTAERAPLTALETQKATLYAQATAYTTLAIRLESLQSALETWVYADGFSPPAVGNGDRDAVGTSDTSGGVTDTDGPYGDDALDMSGELDFVKAYNQLMTFLTEQNTLSASGRASIARDEIVRNLTAALRAVIQGEYVAAGANYSRLSTVGVEFEQTGTITLNASKWATAIKESHTSVETLFNEAFAAANAQVNDYAKTGGLIQSARDRLKDQIATIDSKLECMHLQLDLRRSALQQEFVAADLLMAQLKGHGSSLQALNGQYRLF